MAEAGSDEELDPRIQVELEKLNSSTDVINKLELDLDDARAKFRQLLSDSTREIDLMAKKLGPCVEKARPYYEARMNARVALFEAQKAASRFEKASSAHEAAKEMVTLAEEGFEEKGMKFDQAWQEMLNHATNRVNDSEKERNESAEEHKIKSTAYQKAERRVQELQKSLKRSINKSRPYFEMKAKFHQLLDDQKRQVQLIEETILMTKIGYSDSLKELEKISEEIHEKRQRERQKRAELGVRESGVGAECPGPCADSVDGQPSSPDVREIVRKKIREKSLSLHVDLEPPPPLQPCSETEQLKKKDTNGNGIETGGNESVLTRITPKPQIKQNRQMSLDLKTVNSPSSNPNSNSNTKSESKDLVDNAKKRVPPPLPPRGGVYSKAKANSSSNNNGNANTTNQKEPVNRRRSSEEQSSTATSSPSPPPYQKLSSFVEASPPSRNGAARNSKPLNQYLKVASSNNDAEEDMSDSESLTSMEPMDDSQIDQLLKEKTLNETIEEILSPSSKSPVFN